MGARAAHFGQNSTGPECGAKQPHPTNEHFRLRISTSLYVRKHGRIRKFACQHKVLPSIQCLPMFTFRLQEDTNQPKSCLSQDRFSPGCVAAPWPGAVGWVAGWVHGSPFWGASISKPLHQLVTSHIITGVHQCGYQTSLWLVYIKSSLMSALLRRVPSIVSCKRQMKQIYT